MTSPLFFSSPRLHHHRPQLTTPIHHPSFLYPHPPFNLPKTKSSSNSTTTTIDTPSTSLYSDDNPSSENADVAKIGSRVRVKSPLKVYHIPKLPEFELNGMVGVIKQYVGVWKGVKISANLPYKVEFFAEIEGRGRVKFFAHLKEDEFEYI